MKRAGRRRAPRFAAAAALLALAATMSGGWAGRAAAAPSPSVTPTSTPSATPRQATSPTSTREPAPASQPPAFRLPFEMGPGPDTWLLLQPFGNTTFAYQYRSAIYHAGQGMHFGVDFAARCGTPVVAIGDGVVSSADNVYHGAAPHNLMINHPNGLASFYGHLLSAPFVAAGDEVTAGQVIGMTGDPDLTCTSRPHLHLEIRDAPAHRRAFDPLPLIDADWDRIGLAGGSAFSYEQDLADPRRWQYIGEQPTVIFGQPLLNAYDDAWP